MDTCSQPREISYINSTRQLNLSNNGHVIGEVKVTYIK
jgi:hypothetical protein